MLPSPTKILNTLWYKLTGGTVPDGSSLFEDISDSYTHLHLHLNLTYLLEADTKHTIRIKADENSQIAWIDVNEISQKSNEKWFVERIYSKPVSYTHLDVYKRQLKGSCYVINRTAVDIAVFINDTCFLSKSGLCINRSHTKECNHPHRCV